MSLDDLLTGYGGRAFPLPKIAGEFRGKGGLIVCGDAACVWDDLERFGARQNAGQGSVGKSGFHVMTVNKLVEVFPGRIHHSYSNQPHLLNKFIEARRGEYRMEFGGPEHTHSCNEGAKWRWPWGGQGTSGLGAVLVGVGLGYDQIVLCGLPLDNGPHNGEPHWRKCHFAVSEAAGPKGIVNGENSHWKRARELAFEGKVRSMSGRTAEWLGRP